MKPFWVCPKGIIVMYTASTTTTQAAMLVTGSRAVNLQIR